MNNYIFIPKSKKQIKTIFNSGFKFFILPLKDYSIGFEEYYTLKEINKYASKYNIYVLINRIFNNEEIDNIKEILKDFKNVRGFFIEDKGLLNIIKKEKVIINERTMITNYKTINLYETLGINNIVISNDLTIDEIKEIKKKTNSNLYYFIINKNILLYSKRKLISNYNKTFNLHNKKKLLNIKEDKSKHDLLIKEENDESIIINDKVFSGYKYIKELKKCVNNFIINLNYLSTSEINEIILGISNDNIELDCDDYFLDNMVKYKVGDDK